MLTRKDVEPIFTDRPNRTRRVAETHSKQITRRTDRTLQRPVPRARIVHAERRTRGRILSHRGGG